MISTRNTEEARTLDQKKEISLLCSESSLCECRWSGVRVLFSLRWMHLVNTLMWREAVYVPDILCLSPNYVLTVCLRCAGPGEPWRHPRDWSLTREVGHRWGVWSWRTSDCLLEALSEPLILGVVSKNLSCKRSNSSQNAKSHCWEIPSTCYL